MTHRAVVGRKNANQLHLIPSKRKVELRPSHHYHCHQTHKLKTYPTRGKNARQANPAPSHLPKIHQLRRSWPRQPTIHQFRTRLLPPTDTTALVPLLRTDPSMSVLMITVIPCLLHLFLRTPTRQTKHHLKMTHYPSINARSAYHQYWFKQPLKIHGGK